MENINNITFNGSAATAIEFNNTQVNTLILNNQYQWTKAVTPTPTPALEDIYLVGIDTGVDRMDGNIIHDKIHNADKEIYIAGPLEVLVYSKDELTYRIEGTTKTGNYEDFNTGYASPIRVQRIDDLGYKLYMNYSAWQGGYGGYNRSRITFNKDLSNEKTYYFVKQPDENNNLLFDGEYVTKLVNLSADPGTNSIIIKYYPRSFEEEIDISKFGFSILNGLTGALTAVTNDNIYSVSGGITNVNLTQIDAITFRLDYTVKVNSSFSNLKTYHLIIENDDYRTDKLMLTIVQNHS